MSPTAELVTPAADPAVVARALRPDNTDEMHTRAAGGRVHTEITRDTVAGLHSTVDDYVVNLAVATAVAQHARESMEVPPSGPNDSQ